MDTHLLNTAHTKLVVERFRVIEQDKKDLAAENENLASENKHLLTQLETKRTNIAALAAKIERIGKMQASQEAINEER